jgi:probable F420-dependent oxidoreductase
MKLDVRLQVPLAEVGRAAREFEDAGYSGIWASEATHDPFLPLVSAATATQTVEIGTAIAVAFARSPMTVAVTANDLQAASSGRFILGLGSQVQPHILKRFSMPWSNPAARMREFVLALRAIWACWNDGEPLKFRGEFYTHTLMTPFFSPGANPWGAPKVMLAGVGAQMTEVAGEVADGFICHAFTTERYLRERTIPALARGREKAGKTMAGFQIAGPSFVVTGVTEEQRKVANYETRKQIAFYASTPSYLPVLEVHGWQDVHHELNRLSKAGRWDDMADVIDDEVLDAFAIVAEPEGVAQALQTRFGDVVERISLYLPYQDDPLRWRPVIQQVRQV